MHLISNIFQNNYAYSEGGVLKITSMIIYSTNCSFINNSAPYGETIAAYPIKILLESNITRNISSIQPYNFIIDNGQVAGSQLSINLNFKIIDFYNQTVNTFSNSLVEISLINENKSQTEVKEFSFVGKKSSIITKGKFLVSNITLYSNPPDTILTLSLKTHIISTNSLSNESDAFQMNLEKMQKELRPDLSLGIGDRNISNLYYYFIDIKLRKCIAGEIFNKNLKSCVSCPYKSFSYNPNDTSCTDCPANTVCLGGKQMKLNPGFWRSSNESLNIHECKPYPTSCLYRKNYLLHMIFLNYFILLLFVLY